MFSAMITSKFTIRGLVGILWLLAFGTTAAQDQIPWLEDYASEMVIGKETFQYSFSEVEGKECKVEFSEAVTNQKGKSTQRSWIFYLADIDPNALKFNSRGKAIEVVIETNNAQKFISYYEEGKLDAYVDELRIKMNEVDKSRSFIEALKEHIGSCESTSLSWEDREGSFNWLTGNIGMTDNGDTQWQQEFSRAEKPYLAHMSSVSVNSKGEQEKLTYRFDLTDVDPAGVKLSVSGKSLSVVVPVKDGERFIKVSTPEKTEYRDELEIFVDEMDLARQTVLAMNHLVSNTESDRPEWSSYNEALGFVKDHLDAVNIGTDLFEHRVEFEASPSGIVEMFIKETDADGDSEELTHAFYLCDMMEKTSLEVTRSKITVSLETRDGHDFIKRTSGDQVKGYSSKLNFLTEDIDQARDLMLAFEYAIANSREEIHEFESIGEVNSWMQENLGTLYRENETYEQELLVFDGEGNPMEFKLKLTEEGKEPTETLYRIYPMDIHLEELDIDVSYGRLNVTLETDGEKYVKKEVNGELQNFVDDADVYFSDPLVAKNFIAAVRFLKENAGQALLPEMSREEALVFLSARLQNLEFPEEKYEQKIESAEGDGCLLKVTRLETNSKGASDEYVYEFAASDIHEGNSGISVRGKLLRMDLVTEGNQKLIKPYENGSVEDFEDEFSLYADDVLLAKQIVAAFGVLSGACK
jgi:hypothetical protein